MKTRVRTDTLEILSQGEDVYPNDPPEVIAIEAQPITDDMRHWRLNAAQDGIEKKPQGEIDTINADDALIEVRQPANLSALKTDYATLIKKGQNLSTIQTWTNNNFPTLTQPEKDNMATIIHILCLSVRERHPQEDDFYGVDE